MTESVFDSIDHLHIIEGHYSDELTRQLDETALTIMCEKLLIVDKQDDNILAVAQTGIFSFESLSHLESIVIDLTEEVELHDPEAVRITTVKTIYRFCTAMNISCWGIPGRIIPRIYCKYRTLF